MLSLGLLHLPACLPACLIQGSGVYFDDEGNSYEGEFQAGLRHGRGRAVACSGGADSSSKGSAGAGAAAVAAGDVYEGCWQHDKRCAGLQRLETSSITAWARDIVAQLREL